MDRAQADAIDAEATADDKVSFSRLGYEMRRPTWDDSDMSHVAGRTVVISGVTSGLGRAAAEGFAALGARVVMLARDGARAQAALEEIEQATGNHDLRVIVCDLSSMASVRRAAEEILATEPQVHVLVNNAGVLLNERLLSEDGYELVLATNLLGPFLLTELLLDRIVASAPSRIVEVSSGGMYSQRIDVEDPHTEHREFIGTAVYSRTKRGQVIVTEMRAERLAGTGVVCHSMHPGWAATPGVSSSIPEFEAKFRDVLRTPAQGADTIVWLGSADEPATTSGQFWLDRRPRETHRTDATRETDAERAALWELCTTLTGLADPAASLDGQEA
ncbi:MAG: SDR family NAD(P)-dependent oxidoreductase [Frankiales bacterium]|nr:SDR family NAD(P)-dependent oxidoreductase [Frankiales bacterium]